MRQPADKLSYFRFQVLPGESQEEFDALLAEYHRVWAPTDFRERFLVDDMARAHWKLVRMHRIAAIAGAQPKAAAMVRSNITCGERALRQARRHLLQERKAMGRREEETSERRVLCEAAFSGRLPARLSVRPGLDVLFGNSDPFVSRA